MSNLLKLIQIGKRELALDDDMYRDMLEQTVGVRSAKNLSQWQLSKVLDHMKGLGFKPKPSSQPKPRAQEVSKIKAIWITMHKQGFVRNGNDAAIDAYVRRMTTSMNGRGVERANWLKSHQAAEVLESLKKWHYRLMSEVIISKEGRIPTNDRGTDHAGYDKLAAYYKENYCG
ncbi:gp16 family protein [Vibrio sp. TRT 21S02]|uniref:gp16 family protein n=1 Tax=Vibrio sp. TRT 21S02 TaxID=3418507 RepID=UPI003CF341B2